MPLASRALLLHLLFANGAFIVVHEYLIVECVDLSFVRTVSSVGVRRRAFSDNRFDSVEPQSHAALHADTATLWRNDCSSCR